MGELSRKIGEQGEAVALSFFERIGWSPLEAALDIQCNHPQEHKLKTTKKDRSKHGLDLLFSYLCPLMPRTRRNVLISMKNSDYEKTANMSSRVKDDLQELDRLIECFAFSENRANLNQAGGADVIEDCGVLVRINRDTNIDHSFLGTEAESLARQQNQNLLYFVENERFDFVDSCVNYLDFKLKDRRNTFNIQRNSLTVGAEVRLVESQILPLQSLVGGPIVARSEDDATKALVIFSNENFSEESFKRLVGLGLQCSGGWPSEVRFVFDGYDRTKQTIVDRVRAQLHDKAFARTIQCDSFEIRSRLK
jgi:hypothetical protein